MAHSTKLSTEASCLGKHTPSSVVRAGEFSVRSAEAGTHRGVGAQRTDCIGQTGHIEEIDEVFGAFEIGQPRMQVWHPAAGEGIGDNIDALPHPPYAFVALSRLRLGECVHRQSRR